ncbi:MAG: hypothetical protein ACREIT_02980, partial [Tepidisphaeraceae bacterium]
RARLLTHSDSGVVFVPREAVVTFAGTTKVFTVDPEGKAVEQTIQTGERKDGWVEVTRGHVKPDQSVVIEGANKLATGVPVTIKETVSGAAPSTQASQAKVEVRP